ncbi:uncharacterized protein LOC142634915 [Castanea sativa]|uniref:uncharacterized protein LOC142634915 n=1 Tax=Castanea sativa TaxID=21020 RepID=UPI003F653BE3
MDQSSQVPYSDVLSVQPSDLPTTHMSDKEQSDGSHVNVNREKLKKKLDSSHSQVNDETVSRVDDRSGRVQPTVDVAEIIRRWTHALQRIHKQSLHLRILLLKFLCDEVLNSAKIREHLKQCASMSADLQQKLHSLSSEWRNLKFKEEVVADQVGKVNQSTLNGVGKSVTEEVAIVRTSYHKLMGQLLSRSSCMSPFSTNMNTLEDGLGWPVPNDSSK